MALPPDENWDDDSPRMGKVRRCCTENDLSLDNVHMEGMDTSLLMFFTYPVLQLKYKYYTY